jgi:hypothetical protein
MSAKRVPARGRRYTNDEEREAARKEKYRRYNQSRKGAKRYKRYEEAHPERATRWSPVMLMRARDPLKRGS